MISDGESPADAIGRRYGRDAADDWQRLLARFEFGDGFALVVLLVPDRDGAALCRAGLERALRAGGQLVYRVAIASPPDLMRVGAELPSLRAGADVGAIWVEAVVAQSVPDFSQWESAWRRALERLNQQRNPLRAELPCPVVVVGAAWIVPLFREVAPDLWSVRAQVIRIEPERRAVRDDELWARQEDHRPQETRKQDAPDPDFALAEAERLRGQVDRESDRAVLLARAAQGLLAQGRFAEAEPVLREAADLATATEDLILHGAILHELGRAILDQGRAAEAEAMFRQALALAEEGGDTATSRGITADYLGRAIRDQGRAAEAEAMFRSALALGEEGNAPEGIVAMIRDDLDLATEARDG